MLHGDIAPFLEEIESDDPLQQPDGEGQPAAGSRLFPHPERRGGSRVEMPRSPGSEIAAPQIKAMLDEIAGCMVGPNDREDLAGALSPTPAAFTYFGQFVFHDMVFSRVFGVEPGRRRNRNLRNAVSFGLDLSGLYGRGPSVDGHLYDTPEASRSGTCRFPLGLPRMPDGSPVEAASCPGWDVPRIDLGGGFISARGRQTSYRPLIADARNDDNLMLSQLLATLMCTHNRLVDVQFGNGVRNATLAYDKARTFLTSAYRRAVIHDYLRRVLHPGIWALFFSETGDSRGPHVDGLRRRGLSSLPVEFTFGAARFAHAMVRRSYRVNHQFDMEPGNLQEMLSFSSQRENGDVPVPVKWIVDWKRFAGDGDGVQRARRISPFLSPSLTYAHIKLARDDERPRSVAFMDCWRGYQLNLPTGQAVAAELGALLAGIDGAPSVTLLTGEAMLPTDACRRRYPASARALTDALQKWPDFLTDTPLFYYVLQEASVDGEDGARLGPVGSYIVGAAMAASLFLSRDSEVRPQNVSDSEIDTLAELLALCDPAQKSDEELVRLLG